MQESCFNLLQPVRFLDVSGGRSVEADFPRGTGAGVRRTALHHIMLDRAAALGVRFPMGLPDQESARDSGALDCGRRRQPVPRAPLGRVGRLLDWRQQTMLFEQLVGNPGAGFSRAEPVSSSLGTE
jgi:hypothetical protein